MPPLAPTPLPLSGIGSCSKLGGELFKLSGHICMEKITFLWSDSKKWTGSCPPFPPPMPSQDNAQGVANYASKENSHY